MDQIGARRRKAKLKLFFRRGEILAQLSRFWSTLSEGAAIDNQDFRVSGGSVWEYNGFGWEKRQRMVLEVRFLADTPLGRRQVSIFQYLLAVEGEWKWDEHFF